MALKYVVFSALLAVANAGYLGAPGALSYAAAPAHVSYAAPVAYAQGPVASTAVGSQTQSVYRSHDGNHAVSTYTKAVDTAFSSVRKFDTRVSNDAVAYAPAVAHTYAAPAVATYAAHAPAIATTYATHAPAITTTYAAHAPAIATTYAAHAPAVATTYAAHAPVAYSAPAYAKTGLLGVAYSAAPAVAHISYSSGDGFNYHY